MQKAELKKRQQELLSLFRPKSPIELDARFIGHYFIKVAEAKVPDAKNVGGFGIRDYNLQQICNLIPEVDMRLRAERGKIVFLGNGLCTVPLDFAHRDRPVIIADLVRYTDLFDDFHQLRRLIRELHLPNKIPWEASLQKIIRGIEKEELIPAYYFFGSENVPGLLQEADLVMNHLGPPKSTLLEQLTCLSVYGELWMSHMIEDPRIIPQGFAFQRLSTKASKIRRIY